MWIRTFSIPQLLILFWILAAPAAFAAHVDPEDGQPVADHSLSKRLSIPKTYTTKAGENLEEVANLLYGHRSWWTKIRARNKSLIGYSARDRLPAGTKLSYLAPQIGTNYVVQRNDWLIRIVQWKYGDTSLWEEIYRKNASQIANPNLIYPGENISLGTDGTIRKSSGEIIVRGLNTPAPGAEPGRELATKQKTEEPPILGMKRQYLLAGFMSGIALLLFMPIFWWITRPREQTVTKAEPHLYLEPEEDEPEPELPVEPVRKGFPYTFKRRQETDLSFDKSLIQEEDGEVNRKPNYFTISSKRKKFMRNRKKG
ncbi:MAG: LysM peptidoglycan-binding domain-containing protein [Bdellovibrionota bacterium]